VTYGRTDRLTTTPLPQYVHVAKFLSNEKSYSPLALLVEDDRKSENSIGSYLIGIIKENWTHQVEFRESFHSINEKNTLPYKFLVIYHTVYLCGVQM